MSTNRKKAPKDVDKYGLSLIPTPGIQEFRIQLERSGLGSEVAAFDAIIEDKDARLEAAYGKVVKQDEAHSQTLAKAHIEALEAEGTHALQLSAAMARSGIEEPHPRVMDKGTAVNAPWKEDIGSSNDANVLDNNNRMSSKRASKMAINTEEDDNVASDGATEEPKSDEAADAEDAQAQLDVNAICIWTHLLAASRTLASRRPSREQLQTANDSIQAAYGLATRANDEAQAARCQFYLGLIDIHRGSVRRAADYFHEATKMEQWYIEGKWTREWVAECKRIIEARGDASINSEMASSSDSSLSTDDLEEAQHFKIKPLPRRQTENEGKAKAPDSDSEWRSPEKIDSPMRDYGQSPVAKKDASQAKAGKV